MPPKDTFKHRFFQTSNDRLPLGIQTYLTFEVLAIIAFEPKTPQV